MFLLAFVVVYERKGKRRLSVWLAVRTLLNLFKDEPHHLGDFHEGTKRLERRQKRG